MFRRPLTRIELVLDDKREYEKLQRDQESRRNAAGTSTNTGNGKTDAKVEHRRKKRTIEDRIGKSCMLGGQRKNFSRQRVFYFLLEV